MKLEKLLLTTDLSEESLRPATALSGLAQASGATITLLHVVEDVPIAPHGAALAPPVHAPTIQTEIEAARQAIEKQRQALGADLAVETEVLASADVARTIADYANEHGMDLIVLSTHGRSGFRRMILGSVAEAILRKTHVPVMVFPRQE